MPKLSKREVDKAICSAETYRDILERLVLSDLGTMKARSVTRADVARLHMKWKHTHAHANQMLAIISGVYSFAGRRDLVPEGINPARRIEKFPKSS